MNKKTGIAEVERKDDTIFVYLCENCGQPIDHRSFLDSIYDIKGFLRTVKEKEARGVRYLFKISNN